MGNHHITSQRPEDMAEARELAAVLSRAFEATFSGELIPGILHNFANPLNGIMGRAQILQRRLNDTLSKLAAQFPEAAAALQEPNGKLVSDVSAICRESDRFFNMFQDVSGKFYAIGPTEAERIDIAHLLAVELRFADYYLDFKHEIKKELDLEETSPEITGVYAHYSVGFWSLFRNAMERTKGSPAKSLEISVGHDETHIVTRLKHGGQTLVQTEKKEIERLLAGDDPGAPDSQTSLASLLYLSLRLFRKLGAEVTFREAEGFHEVVVRIPY